MQFTITLEPQDDGKEWYRAELVGSSDDVPYGYGSTQWEAILDLCEFMHEEASDEPA